MQVNRENLDIKGVSQFKLVITKSIWKKTKGILY